MTLLQIILLLIAIWYMMGWICLMYYEIKHNWLKRRFEIMPLAIFPVLAIIAPLFLFIDIKDRLDKRRQ